MKKTLRLPTLLATAAVLFACATASSYDATVFDHRFRATVFDRYWQQVDRAYPFFDQIGLDWQGVRERFRPVAVEAESRSEFYHQLAAMLSLLEDPHAGIEISLAAMCDEGVRCSSPELGLALLGGRLYVVDWPPGTEPPVPPGVRSVYPVPELLAIDGWRPRFNFTRIRFAGPEGSPVVLELGWPGEEPGSRVATTHVIRRPPAERAEPERPHKRYQMPPEKWLRWTEHDGIGYLSVRTFSPGRVAGVTKSSMIERLDRALDELLDTEALVLDLQHNQGGSAEVGALFGGRFVERPVLFGYYHRRWRKIRQLFEPRSAVYRGKLVVLVNQYTGSMAEHVAATLQRSGRALVVGEATFGAEASVFVGHAPDGTRLRFGKHRYTDARGRGIQGVGVHPDVELPLRIEAVRRIGFQAARAEVETARVTAALSFFGREPEVELPRPNVERGYILTRLE